MGSVTGVGSVCEACAYLGAGGGKILAGKTKYSGITFALAENREALHSLVIAVLTGKNALINGRNELTKIIGIEKHQKRAQRRLTESYTKIIEAFEKCTIKANDMANA